MDIVQLSDPEQIKNQRVRRERLRAYIMDQVESARTRNQGKFAMWERMDKLWRNYRFAKPYPWRANIFNPISFFTIETILPKMVLSIYQDRERLVQIQPTEVNDILVAGQADALVNFQLLREMQATLQVIKVIKSSLIFGTGVGKLTWDGEKACPKFTQVPLMNYLRDPDDKDVQGKGWRSEVVFRSMLDLKEKEAVGIYHSIREVQGSMAKAAEEQGYDAQRNLQSYDPLQNIKIREFYGPIPMSLLIDGAGSDERIPGLVVLANDSVIIRDEPNPFDHQCSPYIETIDHVDLMDAYGYGELEPVESIQWMLNDLVNQYLDGRNLELNAMWKASRNADIDFQALVARPGGIVMVGQMDGLERLDFKNQTVSNIQDQNYLTQIFQMGSGVTNLSGGLQGGNTPETLGGTELLTNAAGQRIALKIFLANELLIGPLASRVLSLDKQLMPEEKSVRVLGTGSLLKVLRQDLYDKDFDVYPIPMNVLGSPQTQIRDLANVMQVVGSINPQWAAPYAEKINQLAGLKDPRLMSSMMPAMDLMQQNAQTPNASPEGKSGIPMAPGPMTPEQMPMGTGGLLR